MYFSADLALMSTHPFAWHFFIPYVHYSHSCCIYISSFTFHFITYGNRIWFCKVIRACGLVIFLTLQIGDGIAGLDYLKVKNDVTQ